jgi:copper chaperone CopZ
MKKIVLMIVVGFTLLSAQAQFTKANLQATGLTCAMCSNAVNKALQKLSFVESVRSDIKNSAFSIVFRQNAEVSIDAMKAAVEDAGFSVGSLKISGTFQDVKIANDEHVKIGNDNFHFLDVNSQTLNGEQTLTVVDRDFVTAKAFKKYSAATKKACVKTGKTASCCEKEGIAVDTRIYHVTI